MIKMLSVTVLTTLSFALAAPAVTAANVDVSINIGTPGYYGPLDIRDYGRPQLIYSEPRVIYRAAAHREPVYLHVPPGHAKNWRKHCGKYNACGERVYFVQDSWYNREYVPRYQAQHQRDERRDDRREDYRDDHRGERDGHNKKNYDKHGKGHDKNH